MLGSKERPLLGFVDIPQGEISECAKDDEEADEYQCVGPDGQRHAVVADYVFNRNDASTRVAGREVRIS